MRLAEKPVTVSMYSLAESPAVLYALAAYRWISCEESLNSVNSELPYVIQKIIVAHELGHAVLHRDRGIYAFHEITMYDESSVMEKEANLFAAEFYLDDDEVLDTLNADTTFFTAAASLRVPMELLDFKFRVMKWKGYKLMEPPIRANSNFLRDMDVPENADYC